MHIKRALTIALLSFFVNVASLYNAVMAVWSLVLLIFAIFLLNLRDNDRLPQDKKVFGFIQLWMLVIISFMSTIMGFLGLYLLWFIINDHFAPVVPLSIVLAAIGLFLYYYLLIRLIQEAYGIIKQKGGTMERREKQHAIAMKEKEEPYPSEKDQSVNRSAPMKARYIILAIFLSVFVNVMSVYNLYLGICSIFLLMIVSITALFVMLVNRANKKESKRRNFADRNLSDYGAQKPTQMTNRIAIIFGLLLVYAGGILLTIFQINQRDQSHQFLSTHIPIDNAHLIANSLSVLGYALFVTALILGTIYCIRAMKSEQVFIGKQYQSSNKINSQ